MPALTSSAIEAIKPTAKNQDLTIEKLGMGRGCLILRVLPDGKKIFYYRHFIGGAKKFVLLGSFSPKGKRAWEGIRGIILTLAAAKEGAKDLADIVAEHGDVETYDIKQSKLLALETSRGSFSQLLDVYIQSLKDLGRVRIKNVEGTINLHVRKAHPELLTVTAKDIIPSDIQIILASLVQKGKTRQVNLLRSYLLAAFNYAASHDNDPRRIATLSVSFNLVSNPVALVPQIKEFNKTCERTLSREEMLIFLKELENAPFIPATFLKLAIALGCQRIEQLLRAEWRDYDFDSCVVSLKDGKGRPSLGVRDHLVPLTSWALEILTPLRELNAATHPFISKGKTRMDVGTPSKLAKKISLKMTAEHVMDAFSARDLRRTSETLLASLGVTKEIRAQLLSHGRSSGVQAKHYDRYAYLPEKRAALEKWQVFLTNDS